MEEVFRGRRFRVLSGEVELPNGLRVVRDIIDFGESVVILPLVDVDRFIILRQYRPAVGKWIYELPAGVVEDGEDPRDTAYRELIEETGYRAGRMQHLFNMYLSPGYSNEYMHSFVAEELEYVGVDREEGEVMETMTVDLNQFIDMVSKGLVEDAKTIATVTYYFYRKKVGV